MSTDESITNLPVPVVPEPQDVERLQELLREATAGAAVADDLTAEWRRRAEAAEARVAGLEAQRERRRVRLVALQNDALSMRGSLSPMGEDRKVPFPLGETLTPAVDWLIARVAELEAGPALPWAHSMSDHDLHGFLDDLVSAAMGRWRSEPEVPDRTVLADIEKVCAAWRTPGQGSRLDGSEFDGVTVRLAEPEPEFHVWLHHENRLGHDLPETGGGVGGCRCGHGEDLHDGVCFAVACGCARYEMGGAS